MRNDDAMKSINLILSKLADAVLKGRGEPGPTAVLREAPDEEGAESLEDAAPAGKEEKPAEKEADEEDAEDQEVRGEVAYAEDEEDEEEGGIGDNVRLRIY